MIMAEPPPLEVEPAILQEDDDLHYMHSMVHNTICMYYDYL